MKNFKYPWLLVLMGLIFLAGLYTVYNLYFGGGHSEVFHADDTIPWTLLIASYIFFVLTSTGLTFVSSLYLVFGMSKYKRLAKRAIFLAIASLIAGFISMGLELGNVINMFYYLITPNFTSPIWWMGAFYVLYFFLLVTKFIALYYGDYSSKVSHYIGIVAFFAEILALLTLGSVFGLIEARPTFFGEFIPMYFLMTAFLSGLAAILFFSMLFQRYFRGGIPEDDMEAYTDLGKMMGIVIGITLIFLTWRVITGLYALRPEFATVSYMVKSFPFFIEYVLGLVIPLMMMLSRKVRRSQWGMIVASMLVFFGLSVGRMDLIMIGQLQPLVPKYIGESDIHLYFPTIWEWIITFFVLDIMVIIYLFGEYKLGLSDVK